MITGNNFFKKTPRMWGEDMLPNAPRKFHIRSSEAIREIDLEKEWYSAINSSSDLMQEYIQKSTSPPNYIGSKELITDCKQEIRMQEIEEYILSNCIMLNIQGNLCLWNGSYYKQLNLQSFTQEVRKILPYASQKRISRFSRFKEAYEYMLVNPSLQRFSQEDIDKAQNMIVFRNGIYDGKKRRLIASTSNYPVLFDIDAKYIEDKDLSTEYFDNVIKHATGNDNDVLELCYQTMGYIFSQGIEAKKFFVFATAPDSGKSIIGEFIAKLLGNDNVSSVALNDFGVRFALGTINQKILNFNMDLPATELDKNSIQKLKQLTGDPRIDCEEKYVQSKTVMHHCKFLFASNHPIRLKFDDEAFWRRLVLIPFIKSVGEKDRDYNLARKLWKERDAIATKAARAYSRLLEENYIFQKSTLAQNMLNKWRETDSDNLIRQFFRENCRLVDDEVFIATDIVFKQYIKFCVAMDKENEVSDKAQFSKRFRLLFDLKMGKKRIEGYTSPVNGYRGLELINTREESTYDE